MPEAYGTERLFLTARDPNWLYAAWDLTADQRERYQARAQRGRLVLRAYTNELSGLPAFETDLLPESKSWFVPVPRGGTRYVAELGYQDSDGRWQRVAASDPTMTPPESMSAVEEVVFATIPSEVSLKKIFEVVQQAVTEQVPLIEVVQQLRAEGWSSLPEVVPSSVPAWTPAQARALAAVVRVDDTRRVWMGSLEITELIRRHLQQEISSAAPQPGPPGIPGAPGLALRGVAISSPIEAAPQPSAGGKRFWLNINAELVLYGATEPDAHVSIGGRAIRLRPDGTFSYRFALPDGHYPISIAATSVAGTDGRSVQLEFGRSTHFNGAVSAHPQDPALQPPLEANLS